jgi:hypothetical protein
MCNKPKLASTHPDENDLYVDHFFPRRNVEYGNPSISQQKPAAIRPVVIYMIQTTCEASMGQRPTDPARMSIASGARTESQNLWFVWIHFSRISGVVVVQ